MKKKFLLLLALCTIIPAGAALAEEAATEAELSIDLEEETEEVEELSPEEVITGYLIADAEKYVTFGDYEGLDIQKYIYDVTDDDVEADIANLLYDYATSESVDRPIEDGDTVYMDLTVTVDGEEDTMTDYYIELGYEELGPDVDAQLPGHSTGDTLTVVSDFDEESLFEDWAGKTVQFDITVTDVTQTVIPELTDEFAQENLDCDSADEYRSLTEERLQDSYDAQSESSAMESAITTAMGNCSFTGYPESMMADAMEQVRSSYQSFADMFGMELNDIFESFGMSEEDLEQEAQDSVNRRLFVSALCLKEDLSVTQEDVDEYLEDNYVLYGYESAEAFGEDYDYATLVQSTYETRVGEFLLGLADVTEEEYDMSSEDLAGMDEDEVLNDYDEEAMSEEYWDDLDWEEEGWDEEDWEDESGLFEDEDDQ